MSFREGAGGLVCAVIENAHALAVVYLHGGHVTEYQPHGAEPVLWMSDIAEFHPGKAIRGGIPLCWPWFGPHPSDSDKLQHGFARVSEFEVVATDAVDDGGTELRLRLVDSEQTRSLWPHAFELEVGVRVGETLSVKLTTRNTGAEAFDVGGALHTYFRIGDVERCTITGLDGVDYIDKLDNRRVMTQAGVIAIDREIDCVYLDTEGDCTINDPAMSRRIRVASSGSLSTVVWNPWSEKARRMGDFPDDGYQEMVCIESANAENDVRTVTPGEEHVLAQFLTPAGK